MKVICAGLPKTGTKTMASALRILGYSVYDAPEELLKQRETWVEIFDGKHDKKIFKKMYKDIDAVTDLPSVAVWDQILEAFPNSKVILMKRDSEDQWYKSFYDTFSIHPRRSFGCPNIFVFLATRRLMSFGAYTTWLLLLKSRIACFGHPATCYNTNEMLARSAYRKHEAYVRSVCRQDQLLVYNVNEGWKPLCEFLDKRLPKEEFPHLNKDAEIIHSTLGLEALDQFTQEIKGEIIQRAKTFGLCFLLLVFWILWMLLM